MHHQKEKHFTASLAGKECVVYSLYLMAEIFLLCFLKLIQLN